MAHIVFWEKPGCNTNARQRASLCAAGHTLEVRNLLKESWTELRLLDFLVDLPIRDWFNPNSPRVKSGEVEPGLYDTTGALRAMLEDPLLIRRPLLEIGPHKFVGFDPMQLRQIIPLPEALPDSGCSARDTPCPET